MFQIQPSPGKDTIFLNSKMNVGEEQRFFVGSLLHSFEIFFIPGYIENIGKKKNREASSYKYQGEFTKLESQSHKYKS